ncbi:MAG: hypothetical protein A3F13_06415 [Gammaproteobacteria bacterium RIFCSPHIGHO2_12_FULL_40_19]|nr:MAG: hypothetical protein A3F13_06415 [Gammaproteobacteria bacterium RIFCSPHIGHO2_12_FULL_40_19]
MRKKLSKWLCGSLALSTLTLSGCMMHKPDGTVNDDPFEHYNRVAFAFNMDIDHLVIGPVAKVYDKITPAPLKTGIQNVFANIDEIPTFPNDFLQGNFRYMVVDVWRFAINTTLGIGGLFDVATRLGIQPHIETFGLTLAKWRGGQSAPYFVIPILGPATVQTGMGYAADFYMSIWPYLSNLTTYSAWGVRLLDVRAQYLPADKLIETSFDPYVFVRDAYLQRQTQKIADNQNLSKIPPGK